MSRHRAIDWALVIAWAAVVFGLSATPGLGTGLGGWDLALRKLAHAAEYAVLAVLCLRATGRPFAAVLLAGLYAITDEVHQTFVEGRHGAPLDVVVDTAGATLGVTVWRLSPWTRRLR